MNILVCPITEREKPRRPVWLFSLIFLKRQKQTVVSTTPREFHPCSIKAALPNACDALNARTMAIREYRPGCMSSPASRYACSPARWLSPSRLEVMAHPPFGSVQTECVRLPYDAPPLPPPQQNFVLPGDPGLAGVFVKER